MLFFCFFSQMSFAENNESAILGNAEIENTLSIAADDLEVSKDMGYNVSKKISVDDSNEIQEILNI